MKRLLFYSILALTLFSGSSEGPLLRQPNIIFIMTDDHAVDAISLYNPALIQTPNIDRIGREGIQFANGFVTNSICAPSRAVLLTGKYSHINGLRDNLSVFDTSQMTFPKLLQKAGYQTAVVGKWHLQVTPSGFDYWNILPGQGFYYNPLMIEMGDTLEYTGYSTDVITDIALRYLDNRDRNKPFCLLYHHKAPHRNFMPDTKHLNLFNDRTFPMPSTFYDDYQSCSEGPRMQDMRIENMYLSLDLKLQPHHYDRETGTGGMPTHDAEKDWASLYGRMTAAQKTAWDAHYDSLGVAFRDARLSGKALAEWKYQQYLKDYLRCVVSIDENIGRLLEYLDREGLSKNTVVVYTSDQGFYLGEHGWYDKRYMYEPSLRTPLLIRYPGEIRPGRISRDMVLNLDFAPTLLDFAGIDPPAEMQGQSLRPLCRGKSPKDWRQSMYYHYYQSGGWHHVPKHNGVRTHRYKLIHFYEIDAWELYDLENDPTEIHNLYQDPSYAPVRENLKNELTRLKKHYRDV